MILNLRETTYTEYVVYSVTKIKGKYGFRIKLIFSNDDFDIQQKSGFNTQKEAETKRNEVIADLENHTYVIYPKVKIETFFKHWLNEVVVLSYNSYNSYRNVIFNYIIKELGDKYMINLNQSHIQKLYNKISTQSESIARLTKTIMNTSLKYAKQKNIIRSNIALGINLPKKIKKKEYRTMDIDSSKVLTLDQTKKLVQVSKNSPIYLEVLFALLMGYRISEINGLKYSGIDFINRRLYLHTQLGTEYEIDKQTMKVKTKTKKDVKLKTKSSERWIDIPDLLFEAIVEKRVVYEKNRKRRINDKTNPFRDEGYIVCSTYGKPRSRGYHDTHFKQLLKENELPNIKFHELRHTHTTLLMKANFSPKAVSVLLGHSKEIITVDRYTDKAEIIYDCLDILEPYIESVISKDEDVKCYDYSDLDFKLDDYIKALIDT